MFGKPKDDNGQLTTGIQQPQDSAATKAAEPAPAEHISTISRGMTVIGKVSDEGAVHVFGQIEGELLASSVVVGEGARVEGDLVADELTVGGTVKGTIHANRVKLSSTAVVEGDIFHRSLSIEENARFEGTSKRKDKASDVPRPLPQQPAAETEVEPQSIAVKDARKSNGAASHDESFGAEAS
jgi:cytoskeletal protein CcmA (bactofilin family)